MSPDQSPFDVHQITTSSPSPDSSSSNGTGSPTLLIPDPSLHDTLSPPSSSDSHGVPTPSPTVKFAPFPQVDPNRKRSLAPLGVPARSRRKHAIQHEGGSLLWSPDPDASEESMEDPIISFAKFVKKTGKTLWRKVRKGSKGVPRQHEACSAEPVLDIGSDVCADETAAEKAEAVSEVESPVEEKRGRRASWSSLAERGTLGRAHTARRSTSDLPRQLSVIP